MTSEKIVELVSLGENQRVEFKAVLPPSKVIAPNIAALANSEGGYIIIGVAEIGGEYEVVGLDSDFQVSNVINSALDQLSSRPEILVHRVVVQSKVVFTIEVAKANDLISIANKVYFRRGAQTILKTEPNNSSIDEYHVEIKKLMIEIEGYDSNSTSAGNEFFKHVTSTLIIIQKISDLLYPEKIDMVTSIKEGVILSRLLFSAAADNFEYYMSNLLLEIYLAKPETLRGAGDKISIREVLDCSDINDFVSYISKKKIAKLQRGSIKGFLSENKVIQSLGAISKADEDEIEEYMQIRHLYTHKNGVVDKKFIANSSSSFFENEIHMMSVYEFIDKLRVMSIVVNKLDEKAKEKFSLSSSI